MPQQADRRCGEEGDYSWSSVICVGVIRGSGRQEAHLKRRPEDKPKKAAAVSGLVPLPIATGGRGPGGRGGRGGRVLYSKK